MVTLVHFSKGILKLRLKKLYTDIFGLNGKRNKEAFIVINMTYMFMVLAIFLKLHPTERLHL